MNHLKDTLIFDKQLTSKSHTLLGYKLRYADVAYDIFISRFIGAGTIYANPHIVASLKKSNLI